MTVSGEARSSPVSYDGDEYFLTSAPENWTAAEAEAVSDGGHLASVHSAAAIQWLISAFFTGPASTSADWIGFYDPSRNDGGGPGSAHAQNFVWSDGTPANYTNWSSFSAEPTNAGDNEYFAAMNWFSKDIGEIGTWNDTPLGGTFGSRGPDGPYYGIIEVAIPEPGSALVFLPALIALGVVLRRRSSRKA